MKETAETNENISKVKDSAVQENATNEIDMKGEKINQRSLRYTKKMYGMRK